MAYVDIFSTDKKYQVMLIDPPWNFETYSDNGKDRSAEKHYEVMDLSAIKKLPIKKLADTKFANFMWVTDTHLKLGFEVLDAWGLIYKTVGFYYAKTNKSAKLPNINVDKDLFMGMGYYGRANPEPCLLSTNYEEELSINLLSTNKKAPTRIDAGVRKLIIDHRREHSRKPDEIYTRIERLFGDVPRIELFARQERPGWDCWGMEYNKFNEVVK